MASRCYEHRVHFSYPSSYDRDDDDNDVVRVEGELFDSRYTYSGVITTRRKQ